MSTQKEIENYGGYSITYNADESRFETEGEEETGLMHSDTLKGLRSKIDRLGEEPKVKQPKQNAIRLNTNTYGGSPCQVQSESVTVGSFGYLSRYRGSAERLYAWVTKGKGRWGDRSRVDMSDSYGGRIVLDTPEAQALVKEAQTIGEEVKKYVETKKKEQEKILAKLKPVVPAIKDADLPHWER